MSDCKSPQPCPMCGNQDNSTAGFVVGCAMWIVGAVFAVLGAMIPILRVYAYETVASLKKSEHGWEGVEATSIFMGLAVFAIVVCCVIFGGNMMFGSDKPKAPSQTYDGP